MMEYDIHTVLDAMTLVATSTVIYALLATPIKTTYQADLDSVKFYYVVSRGQGRAAQHNTTQLLPGWRCWALGWWRCAGALCLG